MPLFPLAASPPVRRSSPARQGTSHDGKGAWRSGRSDRECILARASQRGDRDGGGREGGGGDSGAESLLAAFAAVDAGGDW